jgi:hypothetical protein
MNSRTLVSGLLVLVCFASLWVVIAQRARLNDLRAHQSQVLSELARMSDSSTTPAPIEASGLRTDTQVPSELLRLRSEVTLLAGRRQALANVRAENEQLRAQLASRGTNATTGPELPPGYVRKAQAQMVGYGSPQDTIQSFLWAVQNHDFTNLLQAIAPWEAQRIQLNAGRTGRSVEEMFRDADAFIGMGIVSQTQRPDGVIEAKVTVVPDMPPTTIEFVQIDGKWKMSVPVPF